MESDRAKFDTLLERLNAEIKDRIYNQETLKAFRALDNDAGIREKLTSLEGNFRTIGDSKKVMDYGGAQQVRGFILVDARNLKDRVKDFLGRSA